MQRQAAHVEPVNMNAVERHEDRRCARLLGHRTIQQVELANEILVEHADPRERRMSVEAAAALAAGDVVGFLSKASNADSVAPVYMNARALFDRSCARLAAVRASRASSGISRPRRSHGSWRHVASHENKLLLPMVTVDLHTGLRKGELLALKWEEVDFARGCIGLGRRTKRGKGRDVPINQAVYGALAPLHEAADGVDATGSVWGGIRKIDTAYNAALLRAKILDVDVNFHTLRHTFASHYVMRGGSLVKLQAILGHASIRRPRCTRTWRRITSVARRDSRGFGRLG